MNPVVRGATRRRARRRESRSRVHSRFSTRATDPARAAPTRGWRAGSLAWAIVQVMIEPIPARPGLRLVLRLRWHLVDLAARPDEVQVPPQLAVSPARAGRPLRRRTGARVGSAGEPDRPVCWRRRCCRSPASMVRNGATPDGRFWRVEVPGLDAAAARLQPLLRCRSSPAARTQAGRTGAALPRRR